MNPQQEETNEGDNLSLIEEINAALPELQKEKRPNRKPPKPPGKCAASEPQESTMCADNVLQFYFYQI